MTAPDDQKSLVRSRFGRASEAYAASAIHAKGESLALLVEAVRPEKSWIALDVATGAGHTALAFAPRVARVVASDLTREMAATAARLARGRALANVSVAVADAERLPFRSAAFDLVTCRLSFHHFSDQPAALAEMARALKPGGTLGLVDNVAAAGGPIAAYLNRFEQLRDPSHVRLYPRDELEALVREAGLSVICSEQLAKGTDFDDWADRMRATPVAKEELRSMLWNAPEPLLASLAPREEDGKLAFSLLEAVIVAKKH